MVKSLSGCSATAAYLRLIGKFLTFGLRFERMGLVVSFQLDLASKMSDQKLVSIYRMYALSPLKSVNHITAS
jgi:hypothetical protein